MRGRALTTEEEDRVIDAYRAGMNAREIRTKLGVGGSSLYMILDRRGEPRRGAPVGPNSPAWKGGRRVTEHGYVYVWVSPDDPMAEMAVRNRGSLIAMEHRLVMARYIGRPLRKDESVHHINGDRGDNRVENLQLRTSFHGLGHAQVCNDCGSHNIHSLPLKGL